MPAFMLRVTEGPLLYIGCVVLVLACVVLIAILLLRKPKHRISPDAALEGLIGQSGVVTETVDGDAGTGLVEIDGHGWAARPMFADDVYEVGTIVSVIALEGVKLIVRGN